MTRKKLCRYWTENNPGRGYLGLADKLSPDVCFACGRQCNTHVHHIRPLAADPNDGVEGGTVAERRAKRMALPGADDPSNLHLLCRECHRSAPHTPNVNLYWTWFDGVTPFVCGLVGAVQKALESFGVGDGEADRMASAVEADPGLLGGTVKRLAFCHPGNNEEVMAFATVGQLAEDVLGARERAEAKAPLSRRAEQILAGLEAKRARVDEGKDTWNVGRPKGTGRLAAGSETLKRIKAMLAENQPVAKVARTFGVSRQAIYKALEREGAEGTA